MAVPITLEGAQLEAGAPVALFSTPGGTSGYDAAADGQRFLFNTPVRAASPITILLNWKPGT